MFYYECVPVKFKSVAETLECGVSGKKHKAWHVRGTVYFAMLCAS